MRLTRIHVDSALAAGARVRFAGKAASHVTRVLRLGEGDAVILFSGDGWDYPSRIVAVAGGTAEAVVTGREAARAESPLAISLVQGIARAERMDLVVQKATELGVAAIVPVATARSVVRLDGEGRDRKAAHWRGVAIAACEQCGRARVPTVAEPRTLVGWLAEPASSDRRLLLTPGVPASLGEAARGATAIELLVGPEGGLEDGERAAAERAGFRPCHLGPRVLRSETATIAALAILQSAAGDFGGRTE